MKVANEGRGVSQPKEQKKFYSQNYMSILSAPLTLRLEEERTKKKAENTEKTK